MILKSKNSLLIAHFEATCLPLPGASSRKCLICQQWRLDIGTPSLIECAFYSMNVDENSFLLSFDGWNISFHAELANMFVIIIANKLMLFDCCSSFVFICLIGVD
ncbi:hypothetical protein L6452_17523 [Arctium lappa]|uniref:Uncharacterized protein n=1 Tax=Arctium lappa TaxID=4217 RepID=A0ACB9C3R2_ARCLA|nr:hypothetical protein L6452_17523 [Arctium lappa]